MENPQKLTCVLCNKQIPAEAHIHHCENGNPVEVVKIFLGDEPPEHLNIKSSINAFSVRADVSTTIKCSFCNKNDVPTIKKVWKMCSDVSDGMYGEVFVPSQVMCDDCSKSRKDEKLRLEKEMELEMDRVNKPSYLIAEAKRREKEYMEEYAHMTQCEYCGKMLTLTKEDFVVHQDACKSDNAQI